MSAPTLDHVGFVAPRLAPLVESMRRLGFATTAPRPLLRVDAASGASVPLHQESCHAVFVSSRLLVLRETSCDTRAYSPNRPKGPAYQ